MSAGRGRLDVNLQDLETRLDRAAEVPLSLEECQTLKAVVHAFARVLDLLDEQGTTIARLRELLGRARTEKTRRVLEEVGLDVGTPPRHPAPLAAPTLAPGHGRLGAEAYTGAQRVQIPHGGLKPGARCPSCLRGKVYAYPDPGLLVRFVGQPPLSATVYELDKLRCNLCQEIFTAPPPAEVGAEKYDATAAAMIAVLKYGTGLPFYRQAQLQGAMGIPLPVSTLWDIAARAAALLQPVLDELIREAAQGAVFFNDDTRMLILALRRAIEEDAGDPPDRTGVFTSGIVVTTQHQRIALFLTGRKHAGENLAAVLARRATELGPPIQMCDAATRNLPKPLDIILGHCLAHGRRRFVQVAPNFPQECGHVLNALRLIYHHDALAREQNLSPDDRLHLHQTRSGPVMDDLHTWLRAQLDEQRVEPNSGLGQAIIYLLKHWRELTLFLRQSGAPLDNNVVERALKKSILHRKNALFYRTQNGARVGDLYMTFVHTCELNGINAFHYLTELQRHAAEAAAAPGQWLPWNYRETLAHTGPPPP